MNQNKTTLRSLEDHHLHGQYNVIIEVGKSRSMNVCQILLFFDWLKPILNLKENQPPTPTPNQPQPRE